MVVDLCVWGGESGGGGCIGNGGVSRRCDRQSRYRTRVHGEREESQRGRVDRE